jgi:hypothetical protein
MFFFFVFFNDSKVSADGKTGWIAFLSANGSDSVLIQKLNTSDFSAVGEPSVIGGVASGIRACACFLVG